MGPTYATRSSAGPGNPASSPTPLSPANSTSSTKPSPNGKVVGPLSIVSNCCGALEGLNEANSGFWIPPDPQVAVGPTHVLEMVNVQGATSLRSGGGQTLISLQNQIFHTPPGDSLSDPKVLYDVPSGKFIASIIDTTLRCFNLAVSYTSDPTGNWYVYSCLRAANNFFPDQPILGISGDKVVVSTNDFNGNIFMGAQYWVMNKNDVVNGLSLDYQTFGPFNNMESIHPVTSLDATNVQYMVTVGGGDLAPNSNQLTLFSITGVPPGALTINQVNFPINQVSNPPGGVQRGGNGITLNLDDYRVEDAVEYQGFLWLATNTQCTPPGDNAGRACIRLIHIFAPFQAIIQAFDYSLANFYFYYPALRIDGQGDLAMVYGYSSPNDFPSVAVNGQAFNDPLGTLEPANLLANTVISGSAADTSGRYGDYFGASILPGDPSRITVVGEYTTTVANCGACWSTILDTMRVNGFTVSASPTSVTVPVGTSGTSTMTISGFNYYSGTVSLSTSTSSSNLSCSLNPTSVTLPSGQPSPSATSTLSCSGASAGTYTATVTGTSGGATHSVSVTYQVQDFTVAANPTSVTVNAGSTGTSTITVTALNGFSGTINLSANSGACTLSPVSVTGSGASTLSCTFTSGGIFVVTVTGASGTLSHSATVTFTVPDFGLGANPSSITVNAGTSSASTITVSSFNGFAGTVNLGFSVSPSTGLTCSLTPTSVTGSGTSTLSCSGSAGTYTVTIAGTSGILSHSTTVTYTVQDFTISTNPSSISLTLAGSSATSTVTVASLSGFSAAVSLTFSTSPNGPVVSLWPASVTPSPGGSATSTLDISAGSAIVGTYTITVTGTSGSLVHTAIVTVTVTGDFTIASNPATLTIPAGSSGTSNVTLTSLNGFSGTITLASSASVSISAVSIDDNYCRSFGLLIDQQLNYPDFWNSQPNSVIGIGCSSFSYSNTYTLLSGSHFLEFGVSAWVGHWHVQITVNGVLMANVDTAIFNHVHVPFQVGGSSVSPVVTNGPTGSLSVTSVTLSAGGSAAITLTVTTTSSTPPQNYVFTLTTTSGGLSHATTVTVHVVDFSISTSPPSSSLILAGSSTTSTITVASLNGFSGTVPLTVSTSPAGPVVSLWPNSLTISSGGSTTSTLSVSAGAATPGTYTVTVGGTSGGLSHSATVTITVSGDFGISASPTSLSVRVGKSATSTITLTSLSSFAGTISLSNQASISISATTTDDPYCRSFGLLIDQQLNYPDFWNSQPSSVIGTGCGSFSYSNTYSLTTGPHFLEFGVSAFVGHWHVQITVNKVVMASVDTDVSHHVHVAFNIGGISVSPVVTGGPTASLSNPSVTISAGGSGTATLTVSTSKSTPTGTYTVTGTATSGGLSHSVTITVTVA